MNYTKYYTYFLSSHNPITKVLLLLLCPFYRWDNWQWGYMTSQDYKVNNNRNWESFAGSLTQSSFWCSVLQLGIEKDVGGLRKWKERKRKGWRMVSADCGYPNLSESPTHAHNGLYIAQLEKTLAFLSVPPTDWYLQLCGSYLDP